MTEHRSTFGVPKVDLEGRTFGRLFVRFQDDPVKVVHGGRTKWLITWNCRCECGNTKVVWGEHLKRGAIRSCGCLQKEVRKTVCLKHGMCRTPEYNAYTNAINRCASDVDYKGRGIEFRFTSFEQFFSELGPRPKGKTLDRKNNNGHYEPGNVRWATPKEQANNTRSKRIENFSDEELTAEIRRRGWNLLLQQS